MRSARIFIIAMGLSISASAYAQSQYEMNQRAARDFLEADRRLTEIYQSLMAKISPAGKTALEAAQRTWLNFREQECSFETMGTVGGSIHPTVLGYCKANLTKERIADLEKQVNCQEGDLACGGQ